MGDCHGPTWAVRSPALAAATASTGPKRQRSFAASNWHHRGRLSIGGRGTHHLSSQEIASHLAKFFYDRTSLSKPPVTLDWSDRHRPFPDHAAHLGLGAVVHDLLKIRWEGRRQSKDPSIPKKRTEMVALGHVW